MASTNESLKVLLEKLGGEVPDQASNAELMGLIAEAYTAPTQTQQSAESGKT